MKPLWCPTMPTRCEAIPLRPYSLSSLGLAKVQTVALSAFQEGASDGWVDWVESSVLTLDGGSASTIEVSDEADVAEPSGDIGSIAAAVVGENCIFI